MLLGIPRSARCVQRFDDSLNSAIHITYRISLRSSSMREPRDPLLKVVYGFIGTEAQMIHSVTYYGYMKNIDLEMQGKPANASKSSRPSCLGKLIQVYKRCTGGEMRMMGVHMPPKGPATTTPSSFNNDPSAGSPTETLLRLLLPLNDQV